MVLGSDYDFDIFKDEDDFTGFGSGTFKPSRRRWNNRIVTGIGFSTGWDFLWPSHISPELSVIFPYYCKGKDLATNFSLGVQWTIK
jgi:hypothetical protein